MSPGPRIDRGWVGKLTAQEQIALKESEEFFQRPSGRLQKALGRIGRPLDFLFRASPQGLQDGVTNAIYGVLSTVSEGAEAGSSQQAIKDELCAKAGLELEPWERIFTVDYQILDRSAQQKLTVAKRLATVQGGVTGLAGAPGLIADVPTLYFLVFRTLHQIAACLGFPADTPAEKQYLLQVVNVGHHLELRDRRCALLELEQLENQINSKTGATEDIQRAMLAKTIQILASKLASTLLQRKATQAIALVGGAVGAAINRQLVEDVGLTARHAYRRRFLRESALLR